MNILFTVEFYEPRKGGAEEVVRQLAERLVKRGHRVTVATTFLPGRSNSRINGVDIEEFRIAGTSAKDIRAEQQEVERYQAFLQRGFDAVINYAAQIWTSDLAFPVLGKLSAKKIFVPCGYSALRDPVFARYFAELPAVLKKYDKLVYMSPSYQDKVFGDEHGAGGAAAIIPNGAAAEEFLADDNYEFRKKFNINTNFLAICVANHYRDKGHAFVIDAFKRMGRQDTTLVIIGQNPGNSPLRRIRQFFTGCYKSCWLDSHIHSGIRLLPGTDRAMVVGAYKAADVFLFGSKVECAPLVMYESFASRTAFITTPAGNVADHKEVVKIIRSPEEMASVANALLNAPSQLESLTDKAQALWQYSHTWEKITEQYEKLILS
jgi:L-malate glycosyltransferase